MVKLKDILYAIKDLSVELFDSNYHSLGTFCLDNEIIDFQEYVKGCDIIAFQDCCCDIGIVISYNKEKKS